MVFFAVKVLSELNMKVPEISRYEVIHPREHQ